MNPEDEIRFAEAFTEFGEAAELMVEPPNAAVIRGKVRRRRVARVAVAGVAALALIAPASWMLQQAATAEERDTPEVADDTNTTVVEEEPTKAEEPTPSEDATPDGEEEGSLFDAPPAFDELIGLEMDLPSFMPGQEMVDQACPVDGAVLEDGTTGDYMEGGGRIGLLEVVHARMSEVGDREFAVLLLGCRFGEAAAYQAVVLDQSEGTGDWYVGAQLIHSEPNADRPYDIAAADGYGVLVGVAEMYACCDTNPDELDYWVERIRLDDSFEPVAERLEEDEVDGVFSDLTVTADMTETDEEGVVTVKVTVRNDGTEGAGLYFLSACADAGIESELAFADCSEEGQSHMGEIHGLAVGETYTASWTVTVGSSTDETYVRFAIRADTVTAPGIVRDVLLADNAFNLDLK